MYLSVGIGMMAISVDACVGILMWVFLSVPVSLCVNVCMCVFVYLCLWEYVCDCLWGCVSVWVSVSLWVFEWEYVRPSVCVFVSVCEWVCFCLSVSESVCVCVCVCVCLSVSLSGWRSLWVWLWACTVIFLGYFVGGHICFFFITSNQNFRTSPIMYDIFFEILNLTVSVRNSSSVRLLSSTNIMSEIFLFYARSLF